MRKGVAVVLPSYRFIGRITSQTLGSAGFFFPPRSILSLLIQSSEHHRFQLLHNHHGTRREPCIARSPLACRACQRESRSLFILSACSRAVQPGELVRVHCCLGHFFLPENVFTIDDLIILQDFSRHHVPSLSGVAMVGVRFSVEKPRLFVRICDFP